MGNKLNFVQTYNNWSNKLKREHGNHDDAMKKAIGGEFDSIGLLEKDLLIQSGLTKNGYVIDVGCGSGRLSKPLSDYLTDGKYLGVDIVQDFLDFAQKITRTPNFMFKLTDGFIIPEKESSADMVCFFSVFTHLLHEESYKYLQEAKRVLKPTGKIIFSFLEFAIPSHWNVFQNDIETIGDDKPINMFLSRDGITTWCEHLGLVVDGIFDGDKPHIKLSSDVTLESGLTFHEYGNLGQSVCVVSKKQS